MAKARHLQISYEYGEMLTAVRLLESEMGEAIKESAVFRLKLFDPVRRLVIYELRAMPKSEALQFEKHNNHFNPERLQ